MVKCERNFGTGRKGRERKHKKGMQDGNKEEKGEYKIKKGIDERKQEKRGKQTEERDTHNKEAGRRSSTADKFGKKRPSDTKQDETEGGGKKDGKMRRIVEGQNGKGKEIDEGDREE